MRTSKTVRFVIAFGLIACGLISCGLIACGLIASALIFSAQSVTAAGVQRAARDPAHADPGFNDFFEATLKALDPERRRALVESDRAWSLPPSVCDTRTGAEIAPCVRRNVAMRRRAIAVCFPTPAVIAKDFGGRPPDRYDLCPIYAHYGCPRVAVQGSPSVFGYPFLVAREKSKAEQTIMRADCSGEPRTPFHVVLMDANVSLSVVAERPGFVFVDERRSGTRVTSPKAYALAHLAAYDSGTGAEIAFDQLFADTPDKARFEHDLVRSLDGKLTGRCCVERTSGTAGFRDVHLALDAADGPRPDGWAVTASGDLLIAFRYEAFSREFLAGGVVSRETFIEHVVPRYVRIFDRK